MTTATQTRRPAALGVVLWLVGGYLVLSWLTVVAIIVLSSVDPHLVNIQAWVRGIIIAVTSILTFLFARRAARGSQRGLLRLRIIVAILLVAVIAVLFFVPLPAWMVVEQAVCGALLAGTAVLVFRRGRGASAASAV